MINNQIAFKCMNTCKNQVKLVLQRFFTLNLNLQKQKKCFTSSRNTFLILNIHIFCCILVFVRMDSGTLRLAFLLPVVMQWQVCFVMKSVGFFFFKT